MSENTLPCTGAQGCGKELPPEAFPDNDRNDARGGKGYQCHECLAKIQYRRRADAKDDEALAAELISMYGRIEIASEILTERGYDVEALLS